MFFLTLLSLSEHIEFLSAYIAASAITVVSISIYTWFSNKSVKQFASILLLLTALYAIIYSLLQLEDYALLMGTGLLLFILFVLMWITRNLKVSES
jgi:inner membrane protein